MQSFVFILLLVLAALAVSLAWKGYVATSTSLAEFTNQMVPTAVTELTLADVQRTDTDYVLLIINLNVYAINAYDEMKITIYRDGDNLVPVALKVLRAQYAGEIQPAAITYIDLPGSTGPHTYSVRVTGSGKINYDGSRSQFSAIVVASNYPMNGIFSYGVVNPPAVDAFFTASITPSSVTDHVFLFANADMYDLTNEKDGYLQFRRDEAPVGTRATFGNGLGVSATVGLLDSPQTTSSVTYRLHHGRSTMPTSNHVLCNSGQTRSFFGISLPAEQAKVTKVTEVLEVVAPSSWSGIASLSVSITTSGEKVLLMFNADLTMITADPTLVLITIMRNYADISGSTKGLMMIKTGDVVFSRRSPMIMWVDAPPAGTHTYMVACKTPTGHVYQFGVDGAESSIAAVLISDTIRSVAPSIPPSPAPTPPPTYPGTIDCTTSCFMEGSTVVLANEKPFQILLSTLFTLKFVYSMQNGPSDDSQPRYNIIDIRDRETGNSLFAYSMTETMRPQMSYNNTIVAAYGTTISDGAPTVVTIVVWATGMSLTTSYDRFTESDTYRLTKPVDTSDKHYFIYLSNGDSPSAGGVVSDITILGMTDEPTFAPTLTPTRPTTSPTEEPSAVPSWVPSIVPSANPSTVPSAVPVASPSALPSNAPQVDPSLAPVSDPSAVPSAVPIANPSAVPSAVPVSDPSAVPSAVPVANPSAVPSAVPVANPSAVPSAVPVADPSVVPSSVPVANPSAVPSAVPVANPSAIPSAVPVADPSAVPSAVPAANPSAVPSCVPQAPPSAQPSFVPVAAPSAVPSGVPQVSPTVAPSAVPISTPSAVPSAVPQAVPSAVPSVVPVANPSAVPSAVPNTSPSMVPSAVPQGAPSRVPSGVPSMVPNAPPSAVPSAVPNVPPSAAPSMVPVSPPSAMPSLVPHANPTESPRENPTDAPSAQSTEEPTHAQGVPTTEPTDAPNSRPDGGKPTNAPKASRGPTADESDEPTVEPTYDPSTDPTEAPVSRPNPVPGPGPGRSNPTLEPSPEPSMLTVEPTLQPSMAGRPGNPSAEPSAVPVYAPSAVPSLVPNRVPTTGPSAVPVEPTTVPSVVPSAIPSIQPALQRTTTPTAEPTARTTAAPSASVLTVPPTALLVSVNTNRKATVSATITSRGSCTAVWSVDESSLVLPDIALSPLATAVDAASSRTLSLVLAANTLPPQTVLTFSLTCAQSMARVKILTNGPPQPGSFTVTPSSGVEMMSQFALTASQWIDKDLPLMYQFGFVSGTSGNNLILIPKSGMSHASTLLAQGLDVEDYKVTVFATVHDTLEAFSTAYSHAKVLPELSAIELAVQALANSTGVVTATKNAISLGSVVLNAVSCAHAPNCTALHRQSCRKVERTCGACADGYVGEIGDVNSRCITIAAANAAAAMEPTEPFEPIRRGCRSDADCGDGWESCDETTSPLKPFCAVPQKRCPLDCSGHGVCIKRNVNSGDLETDCPISLASCIVDCHCAAGFGGRGCNTTIAELRNRQTLRWKFMEALEFVLHNDDVNIATVSSWSDGLAALTQDSFELSAGAAGEVSAFAQGILSVAATVADFSYESAVGVLDSLSAASVAHTNGNTSDSAAAGTLATLAQFSDLVSSQIVSGQESVEYWYKDFQLTSTKRFLSSNNALQVSLPKAELQDAQALEVSSVELTSVGSGGDEVTMSLIATPVVAYNASGDSFSANPLQLRVESASVSSFAIFTRFVHNTALEFTTREQAAQMRLRTNCTGQGDRSVRELACPGSGELLVHNCSGHAAGVLTSYCPVLAPSCAVLNTTAIAAGGVSMSTNNTACVVASHSALYTMCNCTMTTAAANTSAVRRTRRLDEDSDTAVLNIVSASVYAASEFLDTFDSYDEFTSVESLRRVLIVIVMFSALWAAGILLILTCTGRRKLREPKHKKTLEEIKQKLKTVEKTKTREDVRRYLTNYVVEIFPSVFSNKPIYGRLYGEIKRHHRYLTLFTATEGPSGDKERILTAVDLLSTQTMLMFLLALLYDVQAPTDDGSCVTHLTQDNCLNRRSPFDNSQAYCTWQTPGTDPNDYFCEYQAPRFSLQIVIYISVIVALITALFQSPLDMCMDLLSAPVADDLKIAEEETVINRMGRRLSNAARKVSVVAGNVATATQQKLATTRKSVVGALTRKIPESTEAAHSLASVSMLLIKDSSQQSLKERELHQIRQFHQSGGRHKVYGGAGADNSSSDSDSASGSDADEPEKMERRASRVSRAASTRTDLETTDTVTSGRTSIVSSVDATLVRLTEEISCQRRLLVEDDRELFDSQWGLDPTGEFSQGERSRVPLLLPGKPGAQQLIRGEIAFVKSETAKKCDKLRVATDQHTGLEILHLFIMDLLGRRTPAARIFETKAMEDFKHTQVVTRTSKWMAIAGLIAINAFFVYYAMLTGYRRGLSWQRMYLMACIIQMVVEICLFETMECVWINCAVPILVSAEVRRVGDSIIEVVQHMCTENKTVDTSLFLNAPDYLFVSTNVAKKFPSLMESIVVQTYTNHLPGELAKIWQVGSVARINRHQRIRDATVLASVLAALQFLATAPFIIHRMFVRFSQPFAFSAIVLFWQLIISNVIYLAIALGITFVFFAYCAYMYYLDKFVTKRANSIAPVTAEYVINNHRTRTQTFVGRTPTVLPLTPKSPKTAMTAFESDKITEFVELEDDEGVMISTIYPDYAVEVKRGEDEFSSVEESQNEIAPVWSTIEPNKGVPLAPSSDIADVCAFSDGDDDDGPLHTPSPRARGKTVSLESEYSNGSSEDKSSSAHQQRKGVVEPVKAHFVNTTVQVPRNTNIAPMSVAHSAKRSPKVLETSSKKDLFTMHLANMSSSSEESSNSDSSDSD